MSVCRSLSSNYQPSSQTRKISIGLLVDSQQKTKSAAAKEDGTTVPNTDEETSNSKSNSKSKTDSHGIRNAIRKKQTKAPVPESSPWISTRSFHEEVLTVESLHPLKRDPTLPTSSCIPNKFNGVKEAQTAHSVQLFANQDSSLQSGEGNEKKLNRIVNERKGRLDGTTEGVERGSFEAVQEVLDSGRGVIEDKTKKTENRSSEALKMKLWEILGTASSPNKHFSNTQNVKEHDNSSRPEPNFDQKDNIVGHPRQNSDTIETDTEVDHAFRRPVTRSSTRRRRATKLQPNKNKNGSSFSYKRKQEEKNMLVFEDRRSSEGLRCAVNSGSLLFKAQKSARKRSRIEPRKIFFSEKDIQQEIERRSAQSTAEKESSLGNRKDDNLCCSLVNNMQKVAPNNHYEEKDLDKSEATEKADHFGFSSPALSERAKQQEELINPDLERMVDQQENFLSPTFEFRVPSKSTSPNPTFECRVPSKSSSPNPTFEFRVRSKSSSPNSPLKTNQNEQDISGPAPVERRLIVGVVGNFKTSKNSRPGCYGSNVEPESSDDPEFKDPPARKSAPFVEERDGLSTASSEGRDSESSESGSYMNDKFTDSGGSETLLPNIGILEHSKFMLCPTKRLVSHENAKSVEFSPASCYPQGTEAGDGFHENSEQNEEDGLARAVALFALALERVQSKMKSVAGKKSSEIMMSATEAVRSQLQNVESQIQTDVAKLATLNKSKRKHLEARFREQQEIMKRIHEKFKEEVNQQLLDCSSTVESLQAHQTEFKGTIERQKVSHKKLLSQVGESIEMQLNDAQRRMTTIQKLVREKMLQLKLVIAASLKDGVLN